VVWGAQLGGTVAIAVAIYLFFANGGPVVFGLDPEWKRYALYGFLAASAPALWYLRPFKRALGRDIAAVRERGGQPEPQLRRELLRKLSLGGALCELPMALGVLYLLAGGEIRGFVTAALLSVVLRLSYRPFSR
jgi:hypothetical protein